MYIYIYVRQHQAYSRSLFSNLVPEGKDCRAIPMSLAELQPSCSRVVAEGKDCRAILMLLA